MREPRKLMMRCIVAAALALLPLLAAPAAADDGGEVTLVVGAVTWVGSDAVEVSGRRALVTSATSVWSDGREVSLGSVHVGMAAELEIDDAGRAIELRVKGAVE